MEKSTTTTPAECPYPGCFFCVMKEGNLVKRRANVAKFFKDLPSDSADGQVLAISGLWNTAMAHPNDPEFLELGIFECMSCLIWKGIQNREWLSHDQNIYIPYYAAHIIGSYTMNIEGFAGRAVQAGVIPPLLELLRGRLTWVEQRVAVRALGHLATYDSTFPYLAEHDEILDLAIQLALDSLDVVYTHFLQFVDRRISYHCDLLTRGTGGLEMESRKAEEWASQLQCWSLQLINCFAFKPEFLPRICKPEFLCRLSSMWGGLVNESSPAGVGLLRTICHQKIGRPAVAECPGMIESLCNVARSSDDWQFMAVDILVWLLQDPDTRHKVLHKAAPALVDLVELPSLGEHKRAGDLISSVLLDDHKAYSGPAAVAADPLTNGSINMSSVTRGLLDDLAVFRKKLKWEKTVPKEDLQIKQAAALVVKLEGNARFSSGDIEGAAMKYSEALILCPIKAKKERVVLFSNRAQCNLMLQNPEGAISDTTRALSIHNPMNRHGKSLWRRAQAYEILGLAKESLLDAIMFINECSQSADSDPELKQGKVPDYVQALVKKQMEASWLFNEAVMEHGGIQHDLGVEGGEEGEDEGGEEKDLEAEEDDENEYEEVEEEEYEVEEQDEPAQEAEEEEEEREEEEQEEEIEEGEEPDVDGASEWETASETDTETASAENSNSSRGEEADGGNNVGVRDRKAHKEYRSKPIKVRPSIIFKGVRLQDLVGSNYQNIY